MLTSRIPRHPPSSAPSSARWLGRAVFVWILDVSRTWEIVAMAGLGAVGLLVGVASVIDERQKGR